MNRSKFEIWWAWWLKKTYGVGLYNQDGSVACTYQLSDDVKKRKRDFLLAWNACKKAYEVKDEN